MVLMGEENFREAAKPPPAFRTTISLGLCHEGSLARPPPPQSAGVEHALCPANECPTYPSVLLSHARRRRLGCGWVTTNQTTKSAAHARQQPSVNATPRSPGPFLRNNPQQTQTTRNEPKQPGTKPPRGRGGGGGGGAEDRAANPSPVSPPNRTRFVWQRAFCTPEPLSHPLQGSFFNKGGGFTSLGTVFLRTPSPRRGGGARHETVRRNTFRTHTQGQQHNNKQPHRPTTPGID